MKILHLANSNSFSGAENVICTIIQNSHEDSYYCSPEGPIVQALAKRNIRYIPLPKFTPAALKKVILDHGIDAIHAHDFKASMLALTAAKNIPVISHIHFNFNMIMGGPVFRGIYKAVTPYFRHIFLVSDEIEKAMKFNHQTPSNVSVLPNIISVADIQNKAKQEVVPAYDAIFVGRLIDVKQPLTFLKTIQLLKDQNPGIKAAVLGSGALEEECKRYCAENQLNDHVDFLGFEDNPFPYVKNAKAMIMPSLYEGLPMSALESLALGTPVLSSGAGGLGSLFSKFAGYVTKSNQPEEYARLYQRLIQRDPQKVLLELEEIVNPYTDMDHYISEIETQYLSQQNRQETK